MQKRNPSENIIKVQKENQEKLVVVIKFQKFQKKMTKKKYSVLIEIIIDKLSSERKNSTTTKI